MDLIVQGGNLEPSEDTGDVRRYSEKQTLEEGRVGGVKGMPRAGTG